VTGLYFLQQVLNAFQVSAFYSLLAAAFVLLHGVANRINLAFGAFAMWSAYLTMAGITLATALWPFAAPALLLALGVAGAVLNTAALGLAVHRTVIAPLIRQPSLAMLIATIGTALVLEEIMRIANDSRERWLAPLLAEPILVVPSAVYPVQLTRIQFIVIAGSLLLAGGLALFIARHPFGRTWRACSQDLGMAELCGIDVGRALTASFLLAAASAATSGAFIAAYYGSVSFAMGTAIGLKTLFVAVIGGLNSIAGAFAGALILGFFETMWSAYAGGEWRDVAAFAVLTGLLILRPNGLFAPAGRIDHRIG
jgi:branched-chain amino acid transport system permease protein